MEGAWWGQARAAVGARSARQRGHCSPRASVPRVSPPPPQVPSAPVPWVALPWRTHENRLRHSVTAARGGLWHPGKGQRGLHGDLESFLRAVAARSPWEALAWLRAVTPQDLRLLPRVRNKQPSWAAWHTGRATSSRAGSGVRWGRGRVGSTMSVALCPACAASPALVPLSRFGQPRHAACLEQMLLSPCNNHPSNF